MAEKKKMRGEASSSNSNDYTGAESLVTDVGRRTSGCGYCRSTSPTTITYGLWAHSLTVADYQALLDRGWRRSGCFLYKPEMEETCCPSYTIRLKASEFVPSKEQLRVSKRMQRFLDGTLDAKRLEQSIDEQTGLKACCSYSENESASSMARQCISISYEKGKNKVEQLIQCLSQQIDTAVQKFIERRELPIDLKLPKASVKIVPPAKRKLLVEASEKLMFSCSLSFQIYSALIRAKDYGHENFSKHNAEKNGQHIEMSPHMIAEMLVRHLNLGPEYSNLIVRACNGHINFYSTTNHEQLDGIVSGTVSKEQPLESSLGDNRPKQSIGNSGGKGRHLEIHLKRSSFDPEEYSLYRKYQIRVHNDAPDHVSETSYRRFLVDTPLIFVPPTGDGTVPLCGFGSFHQQYVVDGRLVAVGVIDVLPKCLSSKYLFWDPDLASLSLGKFSALEEIKWICENQIHCPSLQYYYLGYYIHSCNKMRYKAGYRPSELLCPLRYQWIPFDIAKPLLDREKYVVLSDYASFCNGESLTPSTNLDNHTEEQHNDLFDGGKNDELVEENEDLVEVDSEGDVGNVIVGMKSVRLRFKDISRHFGASQRSMIEAQLQGYMSAVGVELSQRMVYSLF